MARANFYMSEKDRQVILDAITGYIGMWSDSDAGMDEEESKELGRVYDKVRNMYNTKSYTNASIKNALEIANRLQEE